jgi:alpha-beta hydrolase superfamily lysophospholipase
MNRSPNTTAFYMGASEAESVFALYDPPATGARRTAVLVCPPFGLDPMCPHRSRWEMATHLAGAGYPVLRIDLPGSGDSAAGPRDPGRLRAWTQAVRDACQWLSQNTGTERLAAIGVGLGGLLTYRAACEGSPIDDLALWAAPARGRSLVRELRAFSLLPSSKVTGPQDPGAQIMPEGAIMAAGYMMSAETARDLEALDLTELALPHASRRRVLMIGRTGTSVDDALRGALEESGAQVSVTAGPGYRPVTELLEPIQAWLDAGDDLPPAQPGRTHARVTPPATAEQLSLTHAGAALRETPLWIERPEGRLFGVLSEPVSNAGGLCAVLLGPQRHIGPSRIWVELARRWASCGIPTLRVDLPRFGEADGDAAELADAGTRHEPGYFADASAVLDCLSARGLPDRFILVGLCSGAYWSLHTAVRDQRVASVAMINPTTLLWDELSVAELHTRGLGRRLLRGFTWRKALSGDISLERYMQVSRSLATRSRRARGHSAGTPLAEGRANQMARYARLFDRLHQRGQGALLVFTRAERLAERLQAEGLFEGGSERWPNLRLSMLETSDEAHVLTSLWLQESIHRLLDESLQGELERSLRSSTIALSA